MTLTIRFIASRGPWTIRKMGFVHATVRALISVRSGSPWNHCVVVLSDGRFVEAGHRKGVAIGYLRFPNSYLSKDIRLPVDERVFLEWVAPRVGKPFDLLAMTVQLLPNCRWHRKGAYYCSTLIAEFLEHALGTAFDRCYRPACLHDWLVEQLNQYSC